MSLPRKRTKTLKKTALPTKELASIEEAVDLLDAEASLLYAQSPHFFWHLPSTILQDPCPRFSGHGTRSSTSADSAVTAVPPPGYMQDESSGTGSVRRQPNDLGEGRSSTDGEEDDESETHGNPFYHSPRNLEVICANSTDIFPIIYRFILGAVTTTSSTLTGLQRIMTIGHQCERWSAFAMMKHKEAMVTIYGDLTRLGLDAGNMVGGDGKRRFRHINRFPGETAFPFPDESFDFIHQHALAEDIPCHSWRLFAQELGRVLRPGGSLEIIEIDPFLRGLGPSGLIVDSWVKHISHRMGHADSELFLRIPNDLRAGGFPNARATILSCPIGPWGGWIGEMLEGIYRGRVGAIKGQIVGLGLCGPDEFDHILNSWCDELHRSRPWIDIWVYTGTRSGLPPPPLPPKEMDHDAK